MLPRLAERGLAAVRVVRQERRPDKRVYRLTRAGEHALRDWLEAATPSARADADVFLLKVFFGGFTTPDVVARHVREYREALAEQVRTYEQLEQRIARSPANRYPLLTLGYGLARARTSLRWADRTLARLEQAH